MNNNTINLQKIHGSGNCHICGKPKIGKGNENCSYPHGMIPDKLVDEDNIFWSWKNNE